YPPLDAQGIYVAGAAYDCVKVTLYGIHKLLEANPSYTIEMLANRSLNHLFTPDAFANTGYSGVTYDPITLNEYGDLLTPFLYFAANYTMWRYDPIDRSTAFGITNIDGSEYYDLPNKPIFYLGMQSLK
ncbi:hypothetical protein HDU76_011820, partial [Blyttiomyces sp. JEL0837]